MKSKAQKTYQKLASISDEGWSKHTPYHWYIDTNEGRIDYWPTTGKVQHDDMITSIDDPITSALIKSTLKDKSGKENAADVKDSQEIPDSSQYPVSLLDFYASKALASLLYEDRYSESSIEEQEYYKMTVRRSFRVAKMMLLERQNYLD